VRDTEEITGETYGPLKVACEDDVQSLHGSRATIVRPGIVAGPHDPTERFTYWVRRAAKGGRIAVPRPEQPVQVIDSMDLARLVTTLLEKDQGGVYNAVGPWPAVTLGELVQVCVDAAGSQAELVPVEAAPGFPLLLPPDGSVDVMFRRGADAAHAAGMPKTPLIETARAVLSWDKDRGEPEMPGVISADKEQELLGGS
jgi:2'-hydroxyisoflavone reductase